MNELKYLKRLSEVKTNTGVKFLTPAAFPGNHCPMHTALALSSNIRGMSTLVVGTSECGNYSRNVIAKPKGNELHWMYVLDASEVVFGCRKGLMEAIREMDISGANVIMLILTCVPEVIGEDIEGIVREMQPQINATLNFVQMGHFKYNSYPSGYWKTLAAFAGLMKPQKTRSDMINILGRSPEEDHIPIPKLLTALMEKGFYLRCLAPKSDIEDFIAAPDARLSLILSPYMNPLAEVMRQKYQIPFISLHETYEVSEINDLYKSVAEILGIVWHGAFEKLRLQALSLQNRVREAFCGTRYISTHRNALMPLPLALYLTEFQMEPLLLHIEEFYPDDRKWAKALLEKGRNPLICHMVNEQADAPVLERLQPDFSFGEIPAGTGQIPCAPYLYELYGQIGYERTVLLLDRMIHTLKSTERQKTRRDGYGTA
ncbi:MAG TPA: nitrogenase component 1 [Anaerovoracaceae bacterium]|nr:nitrogenase component 1 [Anaerovoracaceae bacterium]